MTRDLAQPSLGELAAERQASISKALRTVRGLDARGKGALEQAIRGLPRVSLGCEVLPLHEAGGKGAAKSSALRGLSQLSGGRIVNTGELQGRDRQLLAGKSSAYVPTRRS